MKKLLAIIALVLAPGLAQAQTYSGTVYPSNSNGITCTPISCTITVPVLLSDGSATAPAYAFASASNGGMFYSSGPAFSAAGTEQIRINSGVLYTTPTTFEIRMGVSGKFGWAAASAVAGAADTGLARSSAGVVKVTNGSSGNGALVASSGLTAGAIGYGFVDSTSSGLAYDTTADDVLTLNKGNYQRVMVTGDVALSDNVATTIITTTVADASMLALAVTYSVRASNATPSYSMITGTFYVAIVADGATESCSTIVEAGETSVGSDGATITFTATCDTSGSNQVLIKVQSDSSLSSPTLIGQFVIMRMGIGSNIAMSS